MFRKDTRNLMSSITAILLGVIIVVSYYSLAQPSTLEGNILRYIRDIISYGPRISGYPESHKVANYLADKLRGFGFSVRLQPFNVTVPIDHGSILEIGGEKIRVYALLPNLIETCYTNNLEGELVWVDVKYGDLRDFDGKVIRDKIVVMDFNTDSAWRWAAYLGAKGVIFVYDPQEEISYREEFIKRFWIPLDFPRVVILKSDFEKIRDLVNLGAKAKLKIRMKLETRVAYNVIGFLNVTGSNEYVLAAAYYDTWSIIPSLAIGADDALSAATLLEAARVLASRGVKRNLIIAFFAGHYQALAGAREFIYAYQDTLIPKLGMVLEAHISAYTNQLGIFSRGNFHMYHPTRYDSYILGISKDLFEELSRKGYRVDIRPPNDSPYQAPVDRPYYFEFEPFKVLEIRGLAIATVSYGKPRKTPSDTYEKLLTYRDNIRDVSGAYITALSYIVNDYRGTLDSTIRINRLRNVRGRIVEFNETIGKYIPVPNSTVVFYGTGRGTGPVFLFRHFIIVNTDEKGYFEIHTLVPSDVANYWVWAYNDYPPEGPVKYGPDFGIRALPPFFIASQKEQWAEFSIFKSGSIIFFDILDPDSASPLIELADFEILDRETQNRARYGGFVTEWIGFIPTPEMVTGTIMVFTNPQLAETPRFDIVIGLGGTRWFAAIFNNDSRGYTVGPEQYIVVPFSVIESYKGFRSVNEERFNNAKRTGLFIDPIEKIMKKSKEEWEKAREALSDKRYYEARGHALLAWMLERKAYIALRQLIFDASYSSVFFMLLALPFAYLLERLIFEFRDLRKRFAAFLAIFLVAVIFMIYEHPGFTLIASLPLIAIAFIMMILTIVPLLIASSHAGEAIKELRVKFVGKHFAELDKLSAMVLATSLGIRNLRRRWLRTALLVISILIATMAFVSIISVLSTRYVAPISVYEIDYGYEGILIKQSGYRPLPPLLADQIKTIFGDEVKSVTEIVFYYPVSPIGLPLAFDPETGAPVTVAGILGLSPEEFKILPGLRESKTFSSIFIPGSRPFLSLDEKTVIVPRQVVEKLEEAGLSVSIGDELPQLGLKVVGILNNTEVYYSIVKDLDGLVVMPFAREAEAGGGRLVIRAGRPMEPSDVLIIPAKVAKDMGGYVYAIHIIPKNPEKIQEIAYRIAEIFNYQVYYSRKAGEKYMVTQVSVVTTQEVTGGEALLPEILLLFTILNSILGAVYERRKEVGILSAVGLSPLHVAGIFLMEFTIVAVISSFLGYMAGITAPKIIAGLKVNAGSLWIVFSILASIGITLAATAYPVRYASRLVTPSYERKWRLESHAVRRGDTIEVRIPFVISRGEIDGALSYLREYLELFRGEEGPFAIDDMRYYEEPVDETLVKVIDMKVRVKPFDWGVTMRSRIRVAIRGKTSTWTLIFDRLTGTEHVWLRGVRQMADIIRKQLLMWRGLKPEERAEYVRKAKELRDQ